MPIEPPANRWDLSVDMLPDEHGFVGAGADDEPGTLLAAYRSALFPMPIESGGALGWWSPDPRGVLELDDMHVSRWLRRSMRHFLFRVDSAFEEVVAGCAEPTRPHGWIDDRIQRAYDVSTSLVGPTVSRPGATENSWAACTASGSGGCSQPSPNFIAAPTPRRRRSSLWPPAWSMTILD